MVAKYTKYQGCFIKTMSKTYLHASMKSRKSQSFSGPSQLNDVVAFTALILVLIFKPAGLFGERLAKEDRA